MSTINAFENFSWAFFFFTVTQTPHKLFEETVLDKDNSGAGRFFRDIISSRFDMEFLETLV